MFIRNPLSERNRILHPSGSELTTIRTENPVVSIIARRHRLSLPMATVVCELAGIIGDSR